MKMGLLTNPALLQQVQQMQAALNPNLAFANGGAPGSTPTNSNNNPNLASLSQHFTYLRLLMLNDYCRQQQQQQQMGHPNQSETPSPPRNPQLTPSGNPNALAAAAFFARCLSSSSSATTPPSLQGLNVETRSDDHSDQSLALDNRSPAFSVSAANERRRHSNGFTHPSM